jgi:hypothetical protein
LKEKLNAGSACFDMNDPSEVKAFETKRKKLLIKRIIYKGGASIDKTTFYSNLNKTYEPRRNRRRYHADF